MISKNQLFSPLAKTYPDWKAAEAAIREAYLEHKDFFTPDFTAGDLVRWSYENNVLVRCGTRVNGTRQVEISLHRPFMAAD